MSTAETFAGPDRKFAIAWAALFIIGLTGWVALVFGPEPARAWRALLINFTYFAPLAAALVTWSAVVVASNGSWAGGAERLTWTGYALIAPSFILLFVLWIGSPQWAAWYNADTPQGFWLNNTFLFLRDITALVIFWAVAFWYLRRRTITGDRAGMQLAASVLIVTFCIVFSLIGFDLVMALQPSWRSTIFGAYFFMSALYLGIACWALLTALHPRFGPEVRDDFGKLIITFCILTTYFFFMQLLTYWYENIPREISYIVPRWNYEGWGIVSAIIIAVLYLGPIALFLTKRARRNRTYMIAVALLLMTGIWFERWWLVAPGFSRQPQFGLSEIFSAAGVLGLFGLSWMLSRGMIPEFPAEGKKTGPDAK